MRAAELRRLARRRVIGDLVSASVEYQRIFPLPKLCFDLRGTQAGEAHLGRWQIRLNEDLLKRYGTRFIDETVPHEVAHLIAFRVWGRRIAPHGEEWREVMALFDADPSRCHDYEVQPVRRYRRFRYLCPCREHWLTSIRHNRVRTGTRYLCVTCKGVLTAA